MLRFSFSSELSTFVASFDAMASSIERGECILQENLFSEEDIEALAKRAEQCFSSPSFGKYSYDSSHMYNMLSILAATKNETLIRSVFKNHKEKTSIVLPSEGPLIVKYNQMIHGMLTANLHLMNCHLLLGDLKVWEILQKSDNAFVFYARDMRLGGNNERHYLNDAQITALCHHLDGTEYLQHQLLYYSPS